MIGFKLHKRADVVSRPEFDRSKRALWALAVIWVSTLVFILLALDFTQWYYFVILIAVYTMAAPSPSELFQSYEGYKKRWLKHGGATRGERAVRLGS